MLKRIFALFLAMTMVLSMLPMSAFAADDEDVMETIEEETIAETQPLEEEPTEPEETQAEEEPQEELTEEEEPEAEEPAEDIQEEAEADTGVRYEKISYINPLYRDILTEEDLVPHDPSANQPFASSTVYKSLADAGAYVRSQMVRRVSNISVSLRSTSDDYNALFYGLVDAAMAHTGNPKEGDYLLFQYAGWSGGLNYSVDGSYYVYNFDLTVTYYTTASQETKVDGAVQEVLAMLDLDGRSAYERTRRIYKYICDNVVYDYDHLGNDSYKLQFTAYAALINGTSVCQGYAVLLYRLALEAGIDCRVIPGIGNGGPHAWNIAQLDKLYYNLDSTWDAGMSEKNYDWFLRCNAKFPNHYREAEYETAEFNAAYPMADKNYTPPAVPEGITGKCGENLTWQLTDDGVLRISGTGAMNDYEFNRNQAPWYDHRDSIKRIIIEDGVTHVGNVGFPYCTNLTRVSLGNTVKTIGDGAFNGCSSLTEIVIPDSVVTIGNSAFNECRKLATITIGSGVTEIGSQAFLYCSPKTLYISSIEQWLKVNFKGAYAAPLSYSGGDNKVYVGGKLMQNLVIPEGTKVIPSYTFHNWRSLTSVQIPDSVTQIGEYAFHGCQNMKMDKLPKGLKTIGTYAFGHCRAITKLDIPDSVTSIGRAAFAYCANVTSLTIGGGLTSIDAHTFWTCSSLKTVTIPDNIKTICFDAFRDCTGLTSVVIGKGVNTIEYEAFYGCTKLKQVSFMGDAPAFLTDPNAASYGANAEDTYPFHGVTATAYYPCSNRTWTSAVLQDYSGKLTWVKQHRNAGNICPDCGQILGAYVKAITGPKAVRGGASATFKAETSEKAAVLWKLRPQDAAFASITTAGKLTTKATPEAVEIVVTAYLKENPSVSLDYALSVVPGAEEVILSCAAQNIVDGIIGLNYDKTNEVQLSAELLPGDAIQSGTWKSSSTKIATVDEKGLVKFLKTGTVTITFTASDGSKKKASVKIIAGTPAEGLTVTGEDTLTSGSKTTLETKFTGDPTIKKVTWVSSDPSVATVTAKGAVTAKTVYEEAKVTVTAKTTDGSGVQAKHVITVQPKANVLPIWEGREVVNGKTLAKDADAGRFTLTAPAGTKWKSSSAAVAAVEDGVVTIGKAGSATITATSADGKQTGKVTIKVSKLVKSLSIIASDSQPLISGKSKVTLTANVNADASNKTVTWVSSDPAVAAVSSKGVVTAKAGVKKDTKVTITATAKDGGGAEAQITLTVIPAETMVSIVNHTAITTADGLMLGAGEVLNGRTLVLNVGTDFRFSAVVYPNTGDATARQDVTWSYSAKGIVGVSPDGTMTGLRPGSVTVTVKTASGKTNTVKLKFV